MKKGMKTSSRASRVRRVVPRIGLALILVSLVCIGPARKAEGNILGTCITDSVTYDNIVFSSNGAYTYTQCKTGFKISGTGTVSNPNGVITLTDRKPDRSVSAGFAPGQKTGKVVIYFIQTPGSGTRVFTANQTNPSQICGCSAPD